jgi:hypothetical protein
MPLPLYADSVCSCAQNIRQSGDACLPDGPVITSPDRTFKALKREVIDRRPQARALCGGSRCGVCVRVCRTSSLYR